MKRSLTLIVAMLIWSFAIAQPASYCEVQAYTPGFKNFVAKVSYSDQPTSRPLLVKDEKGKARKFVSEMAVLGYFAEKGWKLVNTVNYKGTTHFYLKKGW